MAFFVFIFPLFFNKGIFSRGFDVAQEQLFKSDPKPKIAKQHMQIQLEPLEEPNPIQVLINARRFQQLKHVAPVLSTKFICFKYFYKEKRKFLFFFNYY